MSRPNDQLALSVWEAGYQTAVREIQNNPDHPIYTRAVGQSDVFELIPSTVPEVRPVLNTTIQTWQKLAKMYYLADLTRGVPIDEAMERYDQRVRVWLEGMAKAGL